jgi:sugar phosphate isomerase/epimerase
VNLKPVTLPFPRLTRSLKRAYPFRTAAPSFIYPADYVPNVRLLAPFFDEIELLFFESGGLPPRRTVAELRAIGASEGLGFNVHLPTDVTLGHPDSRQAANALEALRRACDCAAPLDPSLFCLHVPPGPAGEGDLWSERVRQDLEALATATGGPARIAIETLPGPLDYLDRLVESLELSICMDVGHLLLSGHRVGECAARFGSRLAAVHLHAAADGRDHLPLDRLPEPAAADVLRLLKSYPGIVSLEVFSFEALSASVEWLAGRMGPGASRGLHDRG